MAQRIKTKKMYSVQANRGRERLSEHSGRGGVVSLSKSGRGQLAGYRVAKTSGGNVVSVGMIRRKFGVSQEELARVTGYSTRSIAGWEGGQALSDAAKQKLAETERLRAALAQIMPAENLGEWLRTPNPAFEGQPPLQVVERGESDRLWRMIFQIDAGVAN